MRGDMPFRMQLRSELFERRSRLNACFNPDKLETAFPTENASNIFRPHCRFRMDFVRNAKYTNGHGHITAMTPAC